MDAGHRDIGEDAGAAGGQGQLCREEKEHKPILSKVKEKVVKIKHTLAGARSQAGRGDEPGRDDGEEEEENATLEREAAMEKGGYMEDKAVAMEADPEVHGAPMYESERAPAAQDLVANKHDPQAKAPAAREPQGEDAPGGHVVHYPAAQEARRRDDSPKVRLGDLGGSVVEDPAAPRSRTPPAREGEDIGTTPVVQEFESMTLSDSPAHVGAAKQGARAEDGKDAADDKMGGAIYAGNKLKNVVEVPAEYGRKLASTVREKVADNGSEKHDDDERTEALPISDVDASGKGYGKRLAVASTDEARPASDVCTDERNESEATDKMGGATYTDKLKNVAAVPAEYGTELVSTVREKVTGGTANGSGKRDDDERTKALPVSDAGAGKDTGVEAANDCSYGKNKKLASTDVAKPVSDVGTDEMNESEATDKMSGATYTDKLKDVAAVPAEYGTKLVTIVREKATGGTAVGSEKREDVGASREAGADTATYNSSVSNVGVEERNEAATTDATNAASGPGYTEKIKSATARTTEYGKQLVSTAYEKAAGVGTAVVSKVQQDTSKEEVGGTVVQRVPAPSQVMTKAREAVTSLTGGSRVSETEQPNAATGADMKKNAGAKVPVLHGKEIGERRHNNTNTM